MTPVALILLLIVTVYAVQATLWLYWWQKLPCFSSLNSGFTPISVVVAFRNEEKNMVQLIAALRDQRFPPHLFEVILVDDYSNDNSAVIAAETIKDLNNFRCIPNNARPGKKGAVISGISAANNELIVTTDADTYLSPEWLEMMSSFYSAHGPAMIIAPVNVNSGGKLVRRFFAADFISIMAAGSGAAAGGRPIYCNGANMAFAKSVFLRYNDAMNSSTVSGDDTFLLHTMKKNNEKILLLKSPEALAEVNTPESIREFMQQHIRWSSKSRYYTDPDILYTAWMVFLANISLLVAFILLLTGINHKLFVILFLLKAMADYRLLSGFCSYLQRKILFGDFILFSLIYPVYLMVAAVSGWFAGYSWKGRKY